MFSEWFCLFVSVCCGCCYCFLIFCFLFLAWVAVVDSVHSVSRLHNRGLWCVGGLLGAPTYNIPFEG